ncbi:MAG: YncE family protein [Thermodesulfobacteriota bacterium]
MAGTYNLNTCYVDSLLIPMKRYISIIVVLMMIGVARPASVVGARGGVLYVAFTVPGRLDIYDTSSKKKMGAIVVGQKPFDLALSPDQKWLAVSHLEEWDLIWIINRVTEEVVRKISIPYTRYRRRGETYLMFSPEGDRLYVVDSSIRFLNVITTSDWKLVKKIPLGIQPGPPVLSPDGRRLYVPNLYSHEIMVIDTITDDVIDSLKIEGYPSSVTPGPKGKLLYITDKENNRVVVYDLSVRKVTTTIAVGIEPMNSLIPDGRYLYVLNTFSRNLSIIDTTINENVKTIPIGIIPKKMTLDTDRERLYVVSEAASVEVVDVKTWKQLKSIATDITPSGIVFVPEGGKE